MAMHAHKCLKCETVFYHSDEMKGNAAAHRCPKCGESQWEQYQPANAQLPRFAPASPAYSAVDAKSPLDLAKEAFDLLGSIFFAAAMGVLLYTAVKEAQRVRQ